MEELSNRRYMAVSKNNNNNNNNNNDRNHIDLNNLSECFRENLKVLTTRAMTAAPVINHNELVFHTVRGKNIILTSNNRVARRLETSFCDAIVFTSRQVEFEERVYVRVAQTSDLWTSMIRFGFTSVDPDTLRKQSANETGSLLSNDEGSVGSLDDDSYPFNLPKYVYPDLTNKKGKNY
jgi:hypothetical protein